MSHYYKFKALADGSVASPAVYPMQANPSPGDLSGRVRQLSDLSDACYSLVLRALERALGTPDEDRSFFGVAFPVMHFALPPLAQLLMQTTLRPEAQENDAALGPTAGPAFLVNNQPLPAMIQLAEGLLADPPRDRGQAYQQLWQGLLAPVVQTLQGAAERAGTQDF
jgi:hypothetical protein